MKMNTNRLALLGLKRRKKESLVTIAVSVCTLIFILTLFVLQDSMRKTELEQRKNLYGEWVASVSNADDSMKQALLGHKIVSGVGNVDIYGSITSGGKNYGTVGSIDEELFDLGHLVFMDGRLPDKSGEIAIEMSTLIQLGYSYRLGQEIKLNISYTDPASKKEKFYIKSFQLCGVLQDYTTYWKSELYKPPSAIGLPSDFKELPEVKMLYIGVKKAYFNAVQDLRAITNRSFSVNDYTYYNLPGGSQKPNDIISNTNILTVIISLLSIFFLCQMFFSSLKKRDKSFKMMKLLGADDKKIRVLIFWEAFYIWAASMLIGLMITGGFLWIFSYIVSHSDKKTVYFEFISSNFITGILIVSCSMWIGMTIPAVWTLRSGKITVKADNSVVLKKIKRNPVFSGREIFRRERKIDRKDRLLGYFTSVLCFGVIFIFLTSSLYKMRIYQELGNRWRPDYIFGSTMGTVDLDIPLYHFGEEVPQRVKSIYGIKEVCTIRAGGYLPLEWQGKEKSQYARIMDDYAFTGKGVKKRLIDPEMETEEHIYTYLYCINENESLYEFFESKIVEGDITEEVFAGGEEAILVVPSNEELIKGPSYSDKNIESGVKETTIKPGQDMTVLTKDGNIHFKIGGLIRKIESWQYPIYGFANKPYRLIVSEKLFDKIMGEMKSDTYEAIYAYANEDANYELTDRQMASIQKEYDDASNWRTHKQLSKSEAFSSAGLALICILGVFSLSVIIQWNTMQTRAENERKRTGILRALGMPVKKLKGFYIKKFLSVQMAAILTVIPIGTGFWGYLFYRDLHNLYSYAEMGMADKIDAVIRQFEYLSPWKCLGMGSAAYVLIMVCVSYIPINKIFNKEIRDNIRGGE